MREPLSLNRLPMIFHRPRGKRSVWSMWGLLLVSSIGMASLGCHPLDFSGTSETGASTYKQFVSAGGVGENAWFDPVGASDIYFRDDSTRDGYDAWWCFTISENDCDRLLEVIAKANGGPEQIELRPEVDYPSTWRPDVKPPSWWQRNAGENAQSVHWCYPAGDAERHHGWYILYDRDLKKMWCWHWNHQWSSSQCQNLVNGRELMNLGPFDEPVEF